MCTNHHHRHRNRHDMISIKAIRGKCISLGFITNYAEKGLSGDVSPEAGKIPIKLLPKSASLNCFFLNHYPDMWQSHFHALFER